MRSWFPAVVVTLGILLLLPVGAAAQAGIAGQVADGTGGILPGVTVEARSPALIEQVRTVVTDGAGLYSIVDLRPGLYTVTFSLPGFNTVVREGIELSGNFVANVDAEMTVGSVQETITVTGASPVVDVQQTIEQEAITSEEIAALPGARTLKGRAALVPGVIVPGGNTGAVAHGSDSQDSHTMIGGFRAGQHLVGRGTGQLGVGSVTQTNEAAVEELVYDTGAQGAEFAFSGVRMNAIPKEGGNQLSWEFIGYGTNDSFASDNLNDELRAQGLTFAPQLFSYDFNGVMGGPISQNKVWWFGSFAGTASDSQILDTYFNPDEPSTPEGKGGQLATTGSHFNDSETIRITHQMTQSQKMRYSFDNTRLVNPRGNFSGGVQPEASWRLELVPTWLAQATYTAALSNRLLIEAGFSYQRGDFKVLFQPENGPDRVANLDLSTGRWTRNHYISYLNTEKKKEAKFSVSYVTGSHNLKVGFENRWATARQSNPYNGDVQYTFTSGGTPVIARVVNGPAENVQAIHWDGGAFIQDNWTIDRLTLNLGARYDRFNAGILSNSQDAQYFVPAIAIDEISNTPNWNNFGVRLGAAYDLFGNGRTALKTNFGQYVAGEALSMTSRFNPIYSQGDNRAWTDLNGDGNVLNPDGTPQFDEIGPPSNAAFGQLAGTDKLDPDLPREKNWSYSVSLQHEVASGFAVTASYYRRRYFDQDWEDNLAVSASDYLPFTITAPVDPRFPGGGGDDITVYRLSPDKFGQVDTFVTLSDNYRVYNGFELAADIRLPADGFMMTSFTTGKQEIDSCTDGELENPNNARFCHTTSPFRHVYKLTGGVPLPYDFMLSGHFQIYDTPGSGLGSTPPYISADYSVDSTNSPVPLNPGETITVNLIEPYSLLIPYYKALDMRVSKDFQAGGIRYRVLAEFNNAFNWVNTRSVEESYGSNWNRPTAIQAGRVIRFGTQIRF